MYIRALGILAGLMDLGRAAIRQHQVQGRRASIDRGPDVALKGEGMGGGGRGKGVGLSFSW